MSSNIIYETSLIYFICVLLFLIISYFLCHSSLLSDSGFVILSSSFLIVFIMQLVARGMIYRMLCHFILTVITVIIIVTSLYSMLTVVEQTCELKALFHIHHSRATHEMHLICLTYIIEPLKPKWRYEFSTAVKQ